MADDGELKLSRSYIQQGKPKLALEELHRLLMNNEGGKAVLRTLDSKFLTRPPLPPELLSCFGLCIALAENRIQKGILLCRMALEMDKFQSEFYLNLGKIYLTDNKKSKAIRTFRKGLDFAGENNEIAQELIRLGGRRRPPFPFLPCGNFINKYLGLLLNRLRTRGASKKA